MNIPGIKRLVLVGLTALSVAGNALVLLPQGAAAAPWDLGPWGTAQGIRSLGTPATQPRGPDHEEPRPRYVLWQKLIPYSSYGDELRRCQEHGGVHLAVVRRVWFWWEVRCWGVR
jgi:hypothetical protein